MCPFSLSEQEEIKKSKSYNQISVFIRFSSTPGTKNKCRRIWMTYKVVLKDVPPLPTKTVGGNIRTN